MAVAESLKSLVDRMPDADNRGMYTTGVDKDKIEKAVAEIYAGGSQSMQGLIEMLGEPGSEENVKPHYALHCLVNHALILKDEQGRKQLCDVMAAQLGTDRPKHIQAYLCQELQWAGRKESVAALGKLLTDDQLSAPAAMALTAIQDGAAEQLRAAEPKARGLSRLNIIDALAALEDPSSAGIFKRALTDSDREIRLAAGSGLARVADPTAIDALLRAADVEPGWERVQATKHCLLLAENLLAAGKESDAKRVYRHLVDTRKDPSETYIRLAAAKALAAAT